MCSGNEEFPCVLVGNKADLEDKRADNNLELIARWSDLWNVDYIETSAKTKQNVDKVQRRVYVVVQLQTVKW